MVIELKVVPAGKLLEGKNVEALAGKTKSSPGTGAMLADQLAELVQELSLLPTQVRRVAWADGTRLSGLNISSTVTKVSLGSVIFIT